MLSESEIKLLGIKNLEVLESSRREHPTKKIIDVKVRCSTCGAIWVQRLDSLKSPKSLCSTCRDISKYESYIYEFKNIHGKSYSYLGFNTIFASGRKQLQVNLKCNSCGHIWWMLVGNHRKGVGCNACAIKASKDTLEKIKDRSEFKHKFEYLEFKRDTKSLTIRCLAHNEVFTCGVGVHLRNGSGCKKCKTENRRRKIAEGLIPNPPRKEYSLDYCQKKGSLIHNNKYKYIDLYKNKKNQSILVIECPIHGVFHHPVRYHLGCGNGCFLCKNQATSKISLEFIDALLNYFPQLQSTCLYYGENEYVVTSSKLDNYSKVSFLDFFSKEYNIAIEFYGDYWHGNPKKYTKSDKLIGGILAEEQWEKDLDRITHIERRLKTKVIIVWEMDWRNHPQKVLKDISSLIENKIK